LEGNALSLPCLPSGGNNGAFAAIWLAAFAALTLVVAGTALTVLGLLVGFFFHRAIHLGENAFEEAGLWCIAWLEIVVGWIGHFSV